VAKPLQAATTGTSRLLNGDVAYVQLASSRRMGKPGKTSALNASDVLVGGESGIV
jgi:hypothetical protein